VARSYFNRLVHGGASAPLAPPRPVSNLWKTAQIDAAAAPPNVEPLAANPRSAIQRSRIAETLPSLNTTEVESRSAPHLGPANPLQISTKRRVSATRVSATQASQTSISGETLRPAPTSATTRQDKVSRAEQTQPATTLQTQELAMAATSSPPDSARRKPPTQAAGSRAVQAKAIPTETRLSGAVEPMPVAESAHSDDAARATRTLPPPATTASAATLAHRPQARLQPMDRATPTFREHSRAHQSPIPEEPSEKTNTVQIGKIEVQVLPPPVSSYRQAPPPAQPKGRLARGYALWPSW
jgi:hypothetical protein